MPSKNKIIMAAAGAGKTYGICNEVINLLRSTSKRILLVTYTNKGVESIRNEYEKQNWGVVDERVDIKTWYQFLLSEMIKPYQNYIVDHENLIRSIDFTQMYGMPNYHKRGTKEHYINSRNDVRANTANELAVDCNMSSGGKVIGRLCDVYSHIYIDEIQDVAGSDLDLLNILFGSSIVVTCVGDYKQATFKTHNARKNKRQTGFNILDYFIGLEKKKVVDVQFHRKSRRFNQEICNFSNTIFPGDENHIETIMTDMPEGSGVYLLRASDVNKYIEKYRPVILKYDMGTDTFGYPSYNFGACKGMTFERVLIFPNGPLSAFLKKGTPLNAPSKYYVAATRARHSIAFVADKLFENTNFEYTDLSVGMSVIKTSKYMIQ